MLHYFIIPAHQKCDHIISATATDAICAKHIKDLKYYGLRLNFKLLKHPGSYEPRAVRTHAHDNDALKLQKHLHKNHLPCTISLPALSGFEAHTHIFLHELFHFWQDRHGLFLTPLESTGDIPAHPDLKSAVRIRLFCEALAQTEAIRASWRLKSAGAPEAWAGALRSKNWSTLAQAYQKDLERGTGENQAAASIFMAWYELPEKAFYTKCAQKDWTKNTQRYQSYAPKDDLNTHQFECALTDLADLIPEDQRPPYFAQIDWEAPCFDPPSAPLPLNTFQHGSPVYLFFQD